MINSYCWGNLKNTVREMKIKRVLFYTANDKKNE